MIQNTVRDIQMGKNAKINTNGDSEIQLSEAKAYSDSIVCYGEEIKDLTGAGDLFAAGFLHGYVNNFSLKASLEKGTDLSSKVIQQVGARL